MTIPRHAGGGDADMVLRDAIRSTASATTDTHIRLTLGGNFARVLASIWV